MKSTIQPILGKYYNSVEGGFAVEMTPRGKLARESVIKCLRDGTYQLEYVSCLCGSSQDADILVCSVDRYRIPHRTVLCSNCGLVRTNPRLKLESYIHFYSNYYRAIYERPGQTAESQFPLQQKRARTRASFATKYLSIGSGSRVLEIGCGGGWNLLAYKDMGCDVEGYDYDEEYLEAGRKRGLRLYRGGVLEVTKAGSHFDLIILSHVLEHMLDPRLDLQRLHSALSTNGLLYVEVPSLFAVTSSLPRYWQSAHTYSFVPETLESLMTKCAYRKVAMDQSVRSLWSAEKQQTPEANQPRKTQLFTRTKKFLRSKERRAHVTKTLRGLQALWVTLNSKLGRER